MFCITFNKVNSDDYILDKWKDIDLIMSHMTVEQDLDLYHVSVRSSEISPHDDRPIQNTSYIEFRINIS